MGSCFNYLSDTGGLAFVESGNDMLMGLAKDVHTFTYPSEKDDYHCELLEAGHFLRIKNDRGDEFDTHLIGRYNFMNMAAALAMAAYFKVDSKEATLAVAKYIPANNRSQIIEKQGRTIVLDAYNANPSSVQAALENFAEMSFDGRCFILGDMYELGSYSDAEHRKIIELVDRLQIEKAFFCGKNFKGRGAGDGRLL